jgi:PKD domain
MLTRFMLTDFHARLPRLGLALAGICLTLVGCSKVPLLAPSGSTITLTSSATVLPVNGTTTLVAQVLEEAGTAPQAGTHVTFTTSLGTIQPSEAQTDSSGRVVVTFNAGNQSGTATITALSGAATTGAEGAVKIAIGTAGVGRVIVNASPALVPAVGGQSTISAVVLDLNGNPLVAASVVFTTSAGTLTSAVVNSDQSGTATTVLTTSTTATVTASVGASGGGSGAGTGTGTGTGTDTTTPTAGQASGSVTVGVLAQPTIVITPPATPPSAGLPASFTFTVTLPAANASAVKSLTVNWGDGSGTQNLGAVTGAAVVSHKFDDPDTYVVTATLSDTAGNVQHVSTVVTVIPISRPTVVVTFSATSFIHPANVNFSIQITAPAGLSIQDVFIDFGDLTTEDLGGASGTLPTISHIFLTAGTFTVRVSVKDSTDTVTEGTTVVTIS